LACRQGDVGRFPVARLEKPDRSLSRGRQPSAIRTEVVEIDTRNCRGQWFPGQLTRFDVPIAQLTIPASSDHAPAVRSKDRAPNDAVVVQRRTDRLTS